MFDDRAVVWSLTGLPQSFLLTKLLWWGYWFWCRVDVGVAVFGGFRPGRGVESDGVSAGSYLLVALSVSDFVVVAECPPLLAFAALEPALCGWWPFDVGEGDVAVVGW